MTTRYDRNGKMRLEILKSAAAAFRRRRAETLLPFDPGGGLGLTQFLETAISQQRSAGASGLNDAHDWSCAAGDQAGGEQQERG